MNGFLSINKALHWTSHDVVQKARKILNIKKIGHLGTLDPLATGVLVLAIGSATKFIEYLLDNEKEYNAEIILGEKTETYDSNLFKFTFVRNPFDRLASCFRHIIKKDVFKEDPELDREMSFKQFVDIISKRKINEMDIHFRPQP